MQRYGASMRKDCAVILLSRVVYLYQSTARDNTGKSSTSTALPSSSGGLKTASKLKGGVCQLDRELSSDTGIAAYFRLAISNADAGFTFERERRNAGAVRQTGDKQGTEPVALLGAVLHPGLQRRN